MGVGIQSMRKNPHLGILKVKKSMFTEPIRSVEQAKEYFISMGCSHFHMVREYPERYEEYRRLNITKQTETEWRTEQVIDFCNQIIGNGYDFSQLWIIHLRIALI